MATTSKTTRKPPGLFDLFFGSNRGGYLTKISDGKKSAQGTGNTIEKSQANAKKNWEKKGGR